MKKLSTIFKTLASVSKPPALYNAHCVSLVCLLFLFVCCLWVVHSVSVFSFDFDLLLIFLHSTKQESCRVVSRSLVAICKK